VNKLKLTEAEFLRLFPNRELQWELLNTQPRSEGEFITKYLPSKIWRLNNLYYITDKFGDRVRFNMNRAQFTVYSYLLQHPRLLILKSRQQGISTFWLVSFFDDSIFRSYLNCGLMAQGTDEASKLLERTKFLWDNFDPHVLEFLGRKLAKDNTKEIGFNNHSSLFIRTSFRSATLHRLHISELAKIANKHPERAKETKTGTLQALAPGNIGVIESTAEGANMFKTMWTTAVNQMAAGKLAAKDFLPLFLPWLDDPDCVEAEDQILTIEAKDYFAKIEKTTGRILTPQQRNFWVAQSRELEGDIYQEYPATPEDAFSASKDGTYWSRLYIQHVLLREQKRPNLYDRNLPVYCVMDLGRNDFFVLLFFQFFEESSGKYTIRIIKDYHNNYEDLEHYADYIKEYVRQDESVDLREIGLPHDGVVVELTARGRTRQEILADYGVKNTVILDKAGETDSIDNVRFEMPHIWIDSQCGYIENCFLYYTKKWNDLLNIWMSEPVRNEWKHGADAVRYMVQYVQTFLKTSSHEDEEDNRESSGDMDL
jgi:hypothetical protein